MLLINILKFIHLILTLGLLGTAFYSLILIVFPRLISDKAVLRWKLFRLNKIFLWSLLGALVTGTFLVIPKHFTFRTHWIEAAYFLVGSVTLASLVTLFLLRKPGDFNRVAWAGFYSMVLLVFVVVVFEAVSKASLFF